MRASSSLPPPQVRAPMAATRPPPPCTHGCRQCYDIRCALIMCVLIRVPDQCMCPHHQFVVAQISSLFLSAQPRAPSLTHPPALGRHAAGGGSKLMLVPPLRGLPAHHGAKPDSAGRQYSWRPQDRPGSGNASSDASGSPKPKGFAAGASPGGLAGTTPPPPPDSLDGDPP
jgi:hypothetical protein